MACESLVSQVQHPSNQALKQAVTTNCQLSKVIPLHLTIALAAASACTHARRQVCLRKRVQKNPACDTGAHIASVQLVQRDTVCCAGRGTLHTCMYTLLTVPARADRAVDEPKSANRQRIAAIVTGRLIFTLSWPRAALLHIHVCVCHNRKSKRGDSSFLRRVHLTKTGSSVKMLQSARHWAVAMTTIKAWRPANKQLGCSEALKKQSPHTHSPHATQVYDHKSICVQCVASSLDVSNFLEMICWTPEVHVILLRS